jgi:hypothetical protein
MMFDWFPISDQNPNDWLSICPPNEYRIIRPSELPNIIPQALKAKADSVLVMASGMIDGEGTAFWVANINRVDFKATAIDQQPFALAFVGGHAAGSACMTQHGDWPGRTTEPPIEFWNQIRASGLGHCFSFPELPLESSGQLSTLTLSSHKSAFEVSRNQITRVLNE